MCAAIERPASRSCTLLHAVATWVETHSRLAGWSASGGCETGLLSSITDSWRTGAAVLVGSGSKVVGLRRVKLHGLRHAAGSILARVADPVFVRAFLGHSKLSTTDR